jgi:hypothetical protein
MWQASSEGWSDEPTVCPEHLRFVPCRRCQPGNEKFSSDPADVERTRRYQASDKTTAHPARHEDGSLNPGCTDKMGNPRWSCVEWDGTGLWCDSCLALGKPGRGSS